LDFRGSSIVAEKLIVSLLPGATEMVAAMGGAAQLVGVSHECDWPEAVASLPRVTVTPIDGSQPSAEIHRAVQHAVALGRSVIGLDAVVLRALHPDVIITQQLCDVCAVADGEAMQLACVMDPPPEVVVLSGSTLGGEWDDIRRVGAAIGHAAEADVLALRLEADVAAIAAHARTDRPGVLAIEWLDPLFLAGHWVPEMIAAAGGRDLGAATGSHSTIRAWDEVMALDPDLVFVILCGFDAARGRHELRQITDERARDWLGKRQVIVLDGNAYTSRPGPRLVEGIRQMAAALRDTPLSRA
jgi:iron complex transport system substrate-binding protein